MLFIEVLPGELKNDSNVYFINASEYQYAVTKQIFIIHYSENYNIPWSYWIEMFNLDFKFELHLRVETGISNTLIVDFPLQ